MLIGISGINERSGELEGLTPAELAVIKASLSAARVKVERLLRRADELTARAEGWYPKKAPQEVRPVPVLAEPWPGVPARGRGTQARADACGVPIAKGLTPHGLRHTHKTRMEGFRTPPKLMDERMGHIDGSVQARYSHITRQMREDLMAALTTEWEAALDARVGDEPYVSGDRAQRPLAGAFASTSVGAVWERNSKIFSQISPRRVPRNRKTQCPHMRTLGLTWCFSCRGGGI